MSYIINFCLGFILSCYATLLLTPVVGWLGAIILGVVIAEIGCTILRLAARFVSDFFFILTLRKMVR